MLGDRHASARDASSETFSAVDVLLVVHGAVRSRSRASSPESNDPLRRSTSLRKSFLVAGVAALALSIAGVAIAQTPAP